MNEYGLILLAAGASSRMGQAKQLLDYGGKSLLQHSIEVATQTTPTSVVVLGAHADRMLSQLGTVPVHFLINENWGEGMASSIRCGLAALLEIMPAAAGVIIMVCDQPFISAAILQNLIQTHLQTKKDIVAAAYRDTLGTPVLFSSKFFPELLRLEGQEGAKKLLKQYPYTVATVPFPMGYIDIDTPEDYNELDQSCS